MKRKSQNKGGVSRLGLFVAVAMFSCRLVRSLLYSVPTTGRAPISRQRFVAAAVVRCSSLKDDRVVDRHTALSNAEESFRHLANRGKSWKRLGQLVDLAMVEKAGDPAAMKTWVDVGTDHGLLAAGLALSGGFERILGVDVSSEALRNGAMALKQDLESRNHLIGGLLEFRVGDGLSVVDEGEANGIVLAGMGVDAMLRILSMKSRNNGVLDLNRLAAKSVLIQPTNSKPKHLAAAYQFFRSNGWALTDERIVYLSARWYISARFDKEGTDDAVSDLSFLPGSKIASRGDEESLKILDEYVSHHLRWITLNTKLGTSPSEMEEQWVEYFSKYQEMRQTNNRCATDVLKNFVQ